MEFMFSPDTQVLIADDMLTMRKLVTKSLKDLGFTKFIEAKDGAEAWEKLSTAPTPVGLVLSDWNMPNSSGLDFLRRVRADARFKTLPFLLITAEAEKTQIVEAIKAGVSNYVVKPFTTDTLKEKITAVYNKLYGG